MVSTVSVIIPTYNRRAMLAECLASLAKQTWRPDEIIIVDDASTDDTAQFIKSLHEPVVHLIRMEKNCGVAVARNTGANQAIGEWLVFIDDDCTADPNWLAKLMAGINESAADFAWGRTEYVRAGYHGHFPERLVTNQGGNWPGSGNLAVRREVYLTAGGFDPVFLHYHNEDSEFAIRLVSRGQRYARVPAAVVYHQPMEWTVRSLLRSVPNGSVWPVLKKKYPAHYRVFNPDIRRGVVVQSKELIMMILFPITVPVLFIRYLLNGKRRLGIFFTKWPLWVILRRLYIWREAMRQGVVMI